MPYAVTARLDPDSAELVVAMWNDLAARGVSDEAVSLGYPPHLTLAVYSDAADEAGLLAVTRDGAAEWRAPAVSLASVGLFPGRPAVMFLAPVVTQELLRLHAELVTSLAAQPLDPHYRSGHWVPHVTLAGDFGNPATVFEVTRNTEFPISAVLDTLEVVRFRPDGFWRATD